MRSGTRARRPVAPGPQEPSTIEEIPAMQLPQTPERIKEVPAQALRAVFAGVGQVLLITERVRRRTAGHLHFPPFSAPAVTTATPATTEPPATLQPPTTPEPEPAPEPAVAPEPTVVSEPAPVAAVPEPAPVAAAPEPAAAAADLPLDGYSGLTVASLRARMRSLDTGQLRVLIEYERAHEGRTNVITMFERRIAKLEGAEDADNAVG